MPEPDLPESWLPYWKSFTRSLRATTPPRSEKTISTYGQALRDLARFIQPAPALVDLKREQLELFFIDHNEHHDPNYTAIHYRGLRRWFNWLVEEGDLTVSPMKRIPEPRILEEPIPILSLEDIRKLLATCRNTYPAPGSEAEFRDRRDLALIRFLIDTGARRGGTTTILLSELDLDGQTGVIRAKSGDIYEVPLGAKATRDLDRYLRLRAHHQQRDSPYLWIGMRGPLTENGIYQIIGKRAGQAGLKFPKAVHVFRHSFAHYFRMGGGEEGDLQVLGGWKSRAMLARYGKSMAAERARAAHRKFSPGDQV